MKKISVKQLSLVAVAALAVGCSHDVDAPNQEAEALQNAEQQLGITIDPNQDWKMVDNKTITVQTGPGSYTVKVYHNNPFGDNAMLLAAKENVSGTAKLTFDYPIADQLLYVAREDAKGNFSVKVMETEADRVDWTETAKARTRGDSADPGSVIALPTVSDANFITTAPNGIPVLKGYDTSSKEYLLTSESGSSPDRLQPTQVSNIYVQGNVDLTGKTYDYGQAMYLPGGSTVYLLPGSTLKLDQNTAKDWQNGVNIYVAANATLTTDYAIVLNQGSHIWSKGKIWAHDSIAANGESSIYSTGEIWSERMNVTNSCTLYNLNKLEADYLKVDAAGKFLNMGTTDIRLEATYTNAENNILENRGYFKADAFNWDNSPIYNNCTFDICKLRQTSGAHVATLYNRANSLFYVHRSAENPTELHNVRFSLDDGAVVEFDADVYCKYNVTVDGVGSKKGVFKACTIDYGSGGGTLGGAIYKNNIYVVCQRHKKEPTDEDGGTRYWYVEPNTGVELRAEENFTINTREESARKECGGIRFTDGEGGHEDNSSPMVYSVAFEDTFGGDYDMNDVVLRISENATDKNKLDISLVALGATFDLYLKLDGTNLFDGKELHEVLGVDGGVMVNTGAGETADAVTVTVAKPSGFNFGNPGIVLVSPMGNIPVAQTGSAPYGIVIPGNWKWPRERVRITTAYSQFATFAEDVTNAEAKGWYNQTPAVGTVY